MKLSHEFPHNTVESENAQLALPVKNQSAANNDFIHISWIHLKEKTFSEQMVETHLNVFHMVTVVLFLLNK